MVAAKSGPRDRIVEVAAQLLREAGPSAVTTRGVADVAGVQAPTIYRLFGDKDGLLDAVAEHVMAEFVAAKVVEVQGAESADVDPLTDLRTGWDKQVRFGLANPTLFRLLSDPDRIRGSAAARVGRQVLATRVHRLAATGRMRVTEPHAVNLLHAAGVGAIQTLLATPETDRDPALADALFEAVLTRILGDAADPVADNSASERPGIAALVAFRAVAPDIESFTPAERQLVLEWVDRAIAGAATSSATLTPSA